MRLRTIAALAAILTGVWTFGGTYSNGIGREASCAVSPCPPGPLPGPNPYVLALASLLVLNSLVCLIGPRIVLYSSAVLSILLGASIVPNSSFGDPVVLFAMGLIIATFALNLVAARRKTQISEQSNPMNLPVFG